MKLDGAGVWTAQLDFQPATRIRGIAQDLDALGYGSLWIGENVGREPISQAALLLASTRRLVIATGVARAGVGRMQRPAVSVLAQSHVRQPINDGRTLRMLGRKNYTREELDHCKAAIGQQLAAYENLTKAMAPDNHANPILEAFELTFRTSRT